MLFYVGVAGDMTARERGRRWGDAAERDKRETDLRCGRNEENGLVWLALRGDLRCA